VKKNDKPKKGLPARAWAKVKEEASHYWHGTKLLGQEIKISAKLQYKVLQGQTLTRRERRQVSISPNGGYRSLTCNS
jgi:LETM1 and EF-hand domain-containing protein 1